MVKITEHLCTVLTPSFRNIYNISGVEHALDRFSHADASLIFNYKKKISV